MKFPIHIEQDNNQIGKEHNVQYVFQIIGIIFLVIGVALGVYYILNIEENTRPSACFDRYGSEINDMTCQEKYYTINGNEKTSDLILLSIVVCGAIGILITWITITFY